MYIRIHDPEGVREYGKNGVSLHCFEEKTMPDPYVKYNM